jgi:predicted SnoaL-like aldol condensation-catalyzing enzyme
MLIPREASGHPSVPRGDRVADSCPATRTDKDYIGNDAAAATENLTMSTKENKRVVRRFIKEVLGKGNVEVMDEVLSPNYANPSMGVTNRDGFKAIISGLKKAVPVRDFEVEDLVAEGNSVVFRGTMTFTPASGKKVTARVITYYRLVKGKIVEDEPISMPPLTEVLGGMMPPKSGS